MNSFKPAKSVDWTVKEQKQLISAIAKYGWPNNYDAFNPAIDQWEKNPRLGDDNDSPWSRIKDVMPEKFAKGDTCRNRYSRMIQHFCKHATGDPSESFTLQIFCTLAREKYEFNNAYLKYKVMSCTRHIDSKKINVKWQNPSYVDDVEYEEHKQAVAAFERCSWNTNYLKVYWKSTEEDLTQMWKGERIGQWYGFKQAYENMRTLEGASDKEAEKAAKREAKKAAKAEKAKAEAARAEAARAEEARQAEAAKAAKESVNDEEESVIDDMDATMDDVASTEACKSVEKEARPLENDKKMKNELKKISPYLPHGMKEDEYAEQHGCEHQLAAQRKRKNEEQLLSKTLHRNMRPRTIDNLEDAFKQWFRKKDDSEYSSMTDYKKATTSFQKLLGKSSEEILLFLLHASNDDIENEFLRNGWVYSTSGTTKLTRVQTVAKVFQKKWYGCTDIVARDWSEPVGKGSTIG
jgi:hypothetical protein